MSKKYLFLDTSYYVSIGILDENFEFLDHHLYENRKGSAILHKEIYSMLKENNTSLNEMDAIVISSGPGSYTGMRLAEGFAQILEIDKTKVYSFYHFEIPQLLGHEKGIWCSEAFKSEIFVYEWDGDKNSKRLVKEDTFEKEIDVNDEHVYSHDGRLKDFHFLSTSDLIKKNSKAIFSFVIDRAEHLETYYYRPLEKEFTMSGKS